MDNRHQSRVGAAILVEFGTALRVIMWSMLAGAGLVVLAALLLLYLT